MLTDVHSEAQFLESLHSISATLDDLYGSIFSKHATSLTTGQTLLRDQTLRWILFAVRPLRLNEMANAINVESNAYIHGLETEAIDACGSLIKIEDDVLKPVHHSLREFLLTEHPPKDKILSVSLESSNAIIAKSLLTYISHPSYSRIEKPLNDPHFLRTHPLAEYATLYWVHHVKNATSDHSLQKSITQFFLNSSNYVEWADRLLPHFLPLSVLPIPPRPFNTARFFHRFHLKGQLASYFSESESKHFPGWSEISS